MNIVLLGSGNVATHLGKAFKMAGQNITQVWSRNPDNAKLLADSLAAEAISDISDINPRADLYIISVNDDGIAGLAASLKLKNKLVVHTSGSVGLNVLEGIAARRGVFYPLQTFSKNKAVDFREVPIAIEAADPEDLAILRSAADRLSEKVIEMNSEQRRTLHVAAVFACNFTNHLYAIAKELLEAQQLDFDLIRPLIAETSDKVRLNMPEQVQTGPAVREDQQTMNSHLDLLSDQPDLSAIYLQLSQSIVNLKKRSQG